MDFSLLDWVLLVGILAFMAISAHFVTKYLLKFRGTLRAQWEKEKIEPPKNIAGFGIRAVAFSIDLFLFLFVFGLVLGFITESLGLKDPYIPALSLFIVWSAYYTIAVIRFGNTIGKRLLGLKIVTSIKKPITPGRIAWRAFFLIFINWIALGAGFWLILIDKNKQGLHDKVAYTYVVKVEK